ncbi:MAG: TauD/TfdA family dioxygenase, partial [Solimonas sp.]
MTSSSYSKVGGKVSWKGSEMNWREEGLHIFTSEELEEIDAALRHLKGLGELDLPDILPETFPLARTATLLARIGHDLRHGRGFALLRGLPRETYTADDMARIYFGIGSYLGRPLYQSYQGELLGHVMDHSDLEEKPRAYHSGGKLGMHTDSCDIVALMCLRTARSGGASRIASAAAVHDALIDNGAEHIAPLYRGFYYRRTDLD